MINTIHLDNFKSIERHDFQLSPITVFIGPNGCGKSSVLQALAVLKAFIEAPNRALDTLFNLHYINLGTFKDVAFAHRGQETVQIGVDISGQRSDLTFTLGLHVKNSFTTIEWKKPAKVQMKSLIKLPFVPQPGRKAFKFNNLPFTMVWDGINAVVEPPEKAKELSEIVELHKSGIAKMSILLSRRGFTKPQHQSQRPGFPLASVVTEDQVASLFEDADLEENVMAWTEDVFDVQVRAKPIPPNVTLVTRARRFAPKIVNEGLGLNQATYMFAVLAAAQEGSLTAIEEPEISLHPKAQSRLANIFVEIAKLQKHILITTHSEHILIALLTLVAKGEIPPDFLSIYSFQKTKHTSKPKKLKINEKGQVEGGIKDFFDHELSTSLEYLKALAKGSP